MTYPKMTVTLDENLDLEVGEVVQLVVQRAMEDTVVAARVAEIQHPLVAFVLLKELENFTVPQVMRIERRIDGRWVRAGTCLATDYVHS